MALLQRKGKGLLEVNNRQSLLASEMNHPQFTPPNLPGVKALQNYLIGVKDRISHPLEAAAQASQNMMNADPTELAMNWANPGIAMVGATAYHGSPHLFDKFRMDKIGTGEGAQAYGHGLYFAENPNVAKSYADNLGGVTNTLTGNKVQGPMLQGGVKPPMSQYALDEVRKANGDIGKAIANVQDTIKSVRPSEKVPYKLWNGILNELNTIPQNSVEMNKYMYKVDIPDHAIPKMLDWDKPLSEQSAEVQQMLSNSNNPHIKRMMEFASTPYSTPELAGEVKTMGEAFKGMSMNQTGRASADSANASKLLKQAGIPGIKYLDGGSRGTGQGTSNYVLFDDQLPKILERNGQPLGLLNTKVK